METELLESLDASIPHVREHAVRAERERRVTDEVVEMVRECGFLACVVPTSVGGHGLGLNALAQGTRLLAQADAASAWTMSFLALHGWMLAKLPAEAQIFRSGPVQAAPAPLAPTGTLRPVEGGAIVRGRWDWATGVNHADWVLVHAIQEQPFAMRFALMPVDDVVVEDTWHMSGMCATGSHTVVADDVFVPEARLIDSRELMLSVTPVAGDGLSGIPVASVLGLVAAAPALGAAEAAVEFFRQRCHERVLAYSPGDKAMDQAAAQIRLATMMVELRSARNLWERSIAELDEAGHRGAVDEEMRVTTRLVAAATVRDSRSIINYVCEASGASVYHVESPLQRIQRDVEVLKGHVVFDWDRTCELAGRYSLGFPLRTSDLV